MSKQLYEEALADVAQVRQVAEDNAKRAILEAVTPRIRELIERTLLESADGENVKDESDEELLKGSEHPEKKPVDEVISTIDEMFGSSIAESHRVKGNIMLKAQIAALGSGVKMLQERKSVSPKRLHKKLVTKAEQLLENSEQLESSDLRKVAKLYKILNEAKLTITIDGDALNVAEDQMDQLKVYIEKPGEEAPGAEEAKPAGEGEAPEASAGESGGEAGEQSPIDIDALLGGAPGGGEAPAPKVTQENKKMSFKNLSDDTVVEIDENMLKTEVARMRALREAKEGGNGHKAVNPMAKHFGGGSVEGEAFVDDITDLERLEEGYEDEAMDEEAALEAALAEILGDEAAGDEMMAHGATEDEVVGDEAYMDEMMGTADNEAVEDEAALYELGNRRNHDEMTARKQTNTAAYKDLNEAKAKKAAKAMKDAKDKAAKAKEMKAKAKKAGKKLDEAKADRIYALAVNEYRAAANVARKLQESRSNNASAESEALRNKLAEANLFNAKLLYTNKLLQNESLTPRQKAVVIDRLDEAKSLREVKLVYESLAKALNDTAPRLREGAERKVLGSSSTPVRSAAPTLNEGYESSRWAKLAGIV